METDIKKYTGECIRKTDSLEKEMQSMKVLLEEVQRSLRSGAGARQSGNGSSRQSTDVSSCSFWRETQDFLVGGGKGALWPPYLSQ